MDEELLIRFLTHRCNPEETKQLDEWIASDRSNADWLFEMEQIWSLKDEVRFSDRKEIETAYLRFISRLQGNKSDQQPVRKPPFFLWWMKYVAIIVLAGLLGINLYLMLDKDETAMNIIEVPRGQRVSLTLSDGTKVWLNSQTKFTYPSRFTSDGRCVGLEGEGFFDVAKKKKNPFIISSNLLQIKVTGTKFNAKMYASETASVALEEGSIEVSTNDNKHRFTMKPNEMVTYSDTNGLTVSRSVDVSSIRSWITGEAVYMNEKLENILRDLERKYNVRITIMDDGLSSEVFTCHYKNMATVDQVLNLLKDTRKLDYKMENGQIRIYKPLK